MTTIWPHQQAAVEQLLPLGRGLLMIDMDRVSRYTGSDTPGRVITWAGVFRSSTWAHNQVYYRQLQPALAACPTLPGVVAPCAG